MTFKNSLVFDISFLLSTLKCYFFHDFNKKSLNLSKIKLKIFILNEKNLLSSQKILFNHGWQEESFSTYGREKTLFWNDKKGSKSNSFGVLSEETSREFGRANLKAMESWLQVDLRIAVEQQVLSITEEINVVAAVWRKNKRKVSKTTDQAQEQGPIQIPAKRPPKPLENNSNSRAFSKLLQFFFLNNKFSAKNRPKFGMFMGDRFWHFFQKPA